MQNATPDSIAHDVPEAHPADFSHSLEFILLMAVLMSVTAISIDAMLPALGIIGRELGVAHPNHAQYIISCIFAGMASGQLVFGPLSDAIGRKKILYLCLGLYLVGSAICLTALDLPQMLAGRFVQGLGVAGPYVACMSIIRDRFVGRGMARVMSLVMMIFIMVPAVAPAIGQGILAIASWKYIFVLYVCYALFVLVWVSLRLEETLAPEHRIPFNVRNILRGAKTVVTNRKTLLYTLCMGCVFGALIGDLNACQQIFQVQYGVGEMFAVYFGLQALAFGGSSLINARLVERLGMRYICLRSLAIMVSISLLFLLLREAVAIEFWMFFLYGVVLLFSVGMLFGNLNALAMEPMGDIAGIAAAIIGAISMVIAITFGTIIGQLYDGTLLPILAGFMCLGMLAFLLAYFAEKANE